MMRAKPVIPAERRESRDPGNTAVADLPEAVVVTGSRITAFGGFRDDAMEFE